MYNETALKLFEAFAVVPMCSKKDLAEIAGIFLDGMYKFNGEDDFGAARSCDEMENPSNVGIFCDGMYEFFYSLETTVKE